MALSTVVVLTVACIVLLQACCTVANGNGRGNGPPGHNKDKCSECCDKIFVLTAVLEGVVSRLDKQAQDLDEVKLQVTKSIPLQLERQTLAIEELKASLPPRGVNSSQFEREVSVALEELNVAVVSIASQLERQTLLQERQAVTLGNVSSQLRKQDRDLVEVKANVANVYAEEWKIYKDLIVHDNHLGEHEQSEKSHRELVKGKTSPCSSQ